MLSILLFLISLSAFAEVEDILYTENQHAYIHLSTSVSEGVYSSVDGNGDDVDVSGQTKITNLTYGHMLKGGHFLELSLPYMYFSATELTANGSLGDVHNSQGIREPEVKFVHAKSENGSVYNWGVSFIPSLFERKVASEDSNQFIGGHEISIFGKRGAIYKKWEGSWIGSLKKFFERKEENLDSNVTYISSEFYRIATGLEFQYRYTPKCLIGFYVGMQFTESYSIKSSTHSKDNHIQLGTGADVNVSLKYLQQKDSIYSLALSRTKNDYFVDGETANFRGTYKRYSLSFSYLKKI